MQKIAFYPHVDACLLWQDQRVAADFKTQPEDFIVNEVLDWQFKGQGEHLFLYIEKINSNTAWIAKQLARFYGIPLKDVGYSGLKDRHAVTGQYFSLRLPGIKANGYNLPKHDEYKVLKHFLHDKKLKRGNHKYNDFVIRLRHVKDDSTLIDKRLNFIREKGCPNLFDSQRFGQDNSNLKRLTDWINGEIQPRKRHEKSLLLSALRASVFNCQLAKRVKNNTWQQVLDGDSVILDGSNSHFVVDKVDADIKQRATSKDLHPAGVLVGADSQFDHNSEALTTLMRRERLNVGYRPLRLNVGDLSWQREGDDYILSMRLPSGAYASGVVRQVFDC